MIYDMFILDTTQVNTLAPARFPSTVTFFVTLACNIRCRQCWLHGDRPQITNRQEGARTPTMPFEVYEKTLKEVLVANPAATIYFMGGEPYLHPDLEKMVAAAKVYPQSLVYVYTNGTLLEHRGEGLLRAGIDWIFVSVDGACEQTNDTIRGQGTFEKAINGLKQQLATRGMAPTKFGIAYTVTRYNYLELVTAVKLFDSLGVDAFFVNYPTFYKESEGATAAWKFARITGKSFTCWEHFVRDDLFADIDENRLAAAYDEIISLKRDIRLVFHGLGYSNLERARYFGPQWQETVKCQQCHCLWNETTILPNGDVVACSVFSDTVVGNIRHSSLLEVWEGEKYSKMRTEMGRRLTDICYRCTDLLEAEEY